MAVGLVFISYFYNCQETAQADVFARRVMKLDDFKTSEKHTPCNCFPPCKFPTYSLDVSKVIISMMNGGIQSGG